jgi:hypothetical protein
MRATYQMVRWVVVGLLAGLALAGCTGSGSPGGATPSPSLSPSPSPKTPQPASPSPAPRVLSTGGLPADAESYATAAVGAWAAGDIARLDQLRDPTATIFTTLSAGNYDKHFTLYACQGAAGSSVCTFYNEAGDELVLRLVNQLLGQPHAVLDGQWHPITFPTDNQAYAQEALDAWIGHNDARVGLLCTGDAAAHLNAVAAGHRTGTWTFDHSEGAAGSFYLTWRNPAGDGLVFRFHDPGIPPTPGPQHRIIDVIFQPHP